MYIRDIGQGKVDHPLPEKDTKKKKKKRENQ